MRGPNAHRKFDEVQQGDVVVVVRIGVAAGTFLLESQGFQAANFVFAAEISVAIKGKSQRPLAPFHFRAEKKAGRQQLLQVLQVKGGAGRNDHDLVSLFMMFAQPLQHRRVKSRRQVLADEFPRQPVQHFGFLEGKRPQIDSFEGVTADDAEGKEQEPQPIGDLKDAPGRTAAIIEAKPEKDAVALYKRPVEVEKGIRRSRHAGIR